METNQFEPSPELEETKIIEEWAITRSCIKNLNTEFKFEPSPELDQLETRIIEEAKNWTVTRDQCARAKITKSHQEKNGIGEDALAGFDAGIAAWSTFVAKLGRRVEKLTKEHPIHEWINQIIGLSGKQFAELLLLIGPLWKYPNPQKVYKRLGLHVVDGMALRKKKGKFLGYNTRCKGWAYNIGDLIVKSTGKTGPSPYRPYYDKKKAEYMAREPSGPSNCRFGQHHKNKDGKTIQCKSKNGDPNAAPAHVENAARRYAVKKLVRDLWLAYQSRVGTGLDEANERVLREKYHVVLTHKIGRSRGVPKVEAA